MFDEVLLAIQALHFFGHARRAQEAEVVQGQQLAGGALLLQEPGLLQRGDLARQLRRRGAVLLAHVAVDQAVVQRVDGDAFLVFAGPQDFFARQVLQGAADVQAVHAWQVKVHHQHRGGGKALALAADGDDVLDVHGDAAGWQVIIDVQRHAGVGRAVQQPFQRLVRVLKGLQRALRRHPGRPALQR